jgi:inner membrane protein
VSRLRLSPGLLAGATLLFLLAEWGETMAGASVLPGGPLDEIAHLLTMLIVLWALGDRVWVRFGAAALVTSVAIDLDHIPQYLGHDFLTRGTPRPYPHALLTIAVALVIAAVWPRRRDVFLGIALGLTFHFWRDLSEPGSGVALLWPLSDHSFSLSPASYLLIMAAFVAFNAWKCWSRRPARQPVALSGVGP